MVVNLSRGQVIDEDALVGALASGHLGGACLDVFATEPLPESSPLWDLDNVIISPHSASTAAAENELITELFCDNLRRWLDGAPLRNVYDRAAGYNPPGQGAGRARAAIPAASAARSDRCSEEYRRLSTNVTSGPLGRWPEVTGRSLDD